MEIKYAFIVPHPPLIIDKIGRGEEKKIQNTINSYDAIAKKIAQIKPDTIIVLTPHSTVYADYFHISPGKSAGGNFGAFGAPDVKITAMYDEEFIDILTKTTQKEHIYAGIMGERNKKLDHATMIPLYFINKYYTHYKTVRISISGMSLEQHYKFGKCIKKAAAQSNKNIIIIASGDMSHKLKEDGPYGFSNEGVLFDNMLNEAIKKADFLKFLTFEEDFLHLAAECGLRSFVIMAGVLDKTAVKSEFLSYEGPFGVGYTTAFFTAAGEDSNRNFDEIARDEEIRRLKDIKEKEDDYVRLARLSLESYIKEGKKISPPKNLPDEMLNNRAGVFVSLKKNNNLRGCIGTIEAVRSSIAEEIINNAISAGAEDPRFEPVTEDELQLLSYSVDVLGKAQKVNSKNELDVKKYGVIVSLRGRRSLLLPNLESVDDVDTQINIALKKAGIGEHEPYNIERFEVVRHK